MRPPTPASPRAGVLAGRNQAAGPHARRSLPPSVAPLAFALGAAAFDQCRAGAIADRAALAERAPGVAGGSGGQSGGGMTAMLPPLVPLASMPASSATKLPLTATLPPAAAALEASSWPARTSPSPTRRMLPPSATRPRACTRPSLLTVERVSASAALAVNSTWPPSACSRPWLSASALSAPRSVRSVIRPSPRRSTPTCSAAASAMLPWAPRSNHGC